MTERERNASISLAPESVVRFAMQFPRESCAVLENLCKTAKNRGVFPRPGEKIWGGAGGDMVENFRKSARLPGVGPESFSKFAMVIGAALPVRLMENSLLSAASTKVAMAAPASAVRSFLRARASWWKQEDGAEGEPDLTPLEKAAKEVDVTDLSGSGCRSGLREFVPYSSKLPWHQGPRAFFSWFFPKYGSYCGPNWSSGRAQGSLTWDKPPIDLLDHCCYCHDVGYDSHDQRDLLKADLVLLRCLEATSGHERSDKYKSPRMAEAYRVLCIVGLRRFLIPYRSERIRRIEREQRRRDLVCLKR